MRKFVFAVFVMIIMFIIGVYFSYQTIKEKEIFSPQAVSLIKDLFIAREGDEKQIEIIRKEGAVRTKEQLSRIISPEKEDKFIEEGNKYAVKGDYVTAYKFYDAVIKVNPKNARAYANRSSVRFELKDLSGSIEDSTRAISIDPQRENSYINRAIAYKKAGQYDKTLEDVEVIINRNGKYAADAYSIRGEVFRDTGQYLLSEEAYTKAIAISRSENGYYNRGLVRENLGKYEEALEDFDKAVEINAARGANYYKRGKIKETLRDFDGAENDYEKAVKYNYKQAQEDLNRLRTHSGI